MPGAIVVSRGLDRAVLRITAKSGLLDELKAVELPAPISCGIALQLLDGQFSLLD